VADLALGLAWSPGIALGLPQTPAIALSLARVHPWFCFVLRCMSAEGYPFESDAALEPFPNWSILHIAADESAPPPLPASALAGDFYRVLGDVERGCCIHTGVDPWAVPALFGADDIRMSKLHGGSGSPTEGANKVSQFQDFDSPPDVLADIFFALESTTIVSQKNWSPVDVGNRLLRVLDGDLGAVKITINRKKFSIKAETCYDGLVCALKARFYRREPGFVIEFQRRAGDGIAFNNVYRRALESLSS